MIELLLSWKRVINVDESSFNMTNYIRQSWSKADKPAKFSANTVTPRLSLLAALDTSGNVYYSLSQANTDSDMMMMFMQHLIR